MRRIRVAGLLPYPLGRAPSQRYRFEQWRDRLAAEHSIDLDLLPFADDELMSVLHARANPVRKVLASASSFRRRWRQLSGLGPYEAVVVHRAVWIAGPASLERRVARACRPVIFDFDDAIWNLHTSAANRILAPLKFPGKTAALCRLATHVTVGNRHLAEWARAHNARVTVIPSSVDTDVLRPLERLPNPRVVIGWTGSSTSQQHLEQFAPVLRRILSELDAELRVHSDRRPELNGLPFVWRPWNPETEAAELGAFDVGIMPMPDDPFARGKGAMKALLYMAVGVAAVCSPIPASTDLIDDGRNGFLATSPEDWARALRALCGDPGLRSRMGRHARETVEAGYSAARSAASFADVVRETVGR